MARSSGSTNAHRRCTDRTIVVHRDAVVAACSTSVRESRSIGIGYDRNGHGTATSAYTGYAANFDQGEGTVDQSRPFRYNCRAARDSRKFHVCNKENCYLFHFYLFIYFFYFSLYSLFVYLVFHLLGQLNRQD